MARIQDLLEKFSAGTCSREEFDELMRYLQDNENEEAIRAQLRKIFESAGSEAISDFHIDERGDMQQMAEREMEKPKFRIGRFISIAAASVLCIVAATWLLKTTPKAIKPAREEEAKTVSRIWTPAGSKSSIVLPDGSEVWLNSVSTLTYSTADFNKGKREVTLVGEAMFKVKHDSLHEFLVHTKNFDVTDLGTVFNIQAYPEDDNAQASLISGSIEVTTKGRNAKKVTLEPNQRIVVQNEESRPLHTKRPIESTIKPVLLTPKIIVAPDTAWLVNKLIFSDETFYDLALRMQRHFNVIIRFENEKAKSFRFAGRFEDENVEEALKELQAIAPFNYKRTGNEILIK